MAETSKCFHRRWWGGVFLNPVRLKGTIGHLVLLTTNLFTDFLPHGITWNFVVKKKTSATSERNANNLMTQMKDVIIILTH